MGYTHYHYTKPELDVKKWKQFTDGVKKILALDTGNILAREYDDTGKKPEVTSKHVRFNGKNDEGHETFMLSRISKVADYQSDKSMAFNFCKTARKEYDKFVTACLIYAKLIFGDDVIISSDGEVVDWQAGKSLVEKALVKDEFEIVIESDADGKLDCKVIEKVAQKA